MIMQNQTQVTQVFVPLMAILLKFLTTFYTKNQTKDHHWVGPIATQPQPNLLAVSSQGVLFPIYDNIGLLFLFFCIFFMQDNQ